MANLTKILAAGAVAISMAGTASAATFSLDGLLGSTELSSRFGPTGNGTFYGDPAGLAVGNTISTYDGSGGAGLVVNGVGKYKLTFTLAGCEARANDALYEIGDALNKLIRSQANIGKSVSMIVTAGYAPFAFSTVTRQSDIGPNNEGFPSPEGATLSIENGGGSDFANLRIGFGPISEDGRKITILFDDGRISEDGEPDYDDMIVTAELAPIPVPAAGLLLVGALGALGAVRRRKTA
jgi:hypothetical protein